MFKVDRKNGIRAIKHVCGTPYSFTFEALVEGIWVLCTDPCGNWAYVEKTAECYSHFAVDVGWWELNQLWNAAHQMAEQQ